MNARQVEARRWFRQAEDDLRAVRALRSAGLYAAACFYSQQAAKKALKAVLFSQGARVALGHAVRDLAQQCEKHDARFGRVLETAALLDQFYIPTRYPNGLPSPSVPSETYGEAQAQTALAGAEQVLAAVDAFLGSNTDVLE